MQDSDLQNKTTLKLDLCQFNELVENAYVNYHAGQSETSELISTYDLTHFCIGLKFT